MDRRKHIVAIVNPVSGTGNKAKLPRLIEEVAGGSEATVQVVTTTHAGHAHELAAEAARQGCDVVAAVGGDGTVNEVGSALCGTSTALAIVPCGSGNGLARHLRIPMNTARAVQLLASGGRVVRFDYCTANGHPFFCTCGMGFDAQVSQRFASEGTRGFITYVKTAVSEYFKYSARQFTIDIDGAVMTERAFIIALCNAAQYGNNAFIAPRATMQDGLVDMTVMHPFSIAESPLIGARLFTRTLEQDRHVSIYRGKRIVVEREGDEVIHLDGDPLMMPARVEVVSHQQGIGIVVPADTAGDV